MPPQMTTDSIRPTSSYKLATPAALPDPIVLGLSILIANVSTSARSRQIASLLLVVLLDGSTKSKFVWHGRHVW